MKNHTKAFLIGVMLIGLISGLSMFMMEALQNKYISWLTWGSLIVGSFFTAVISKQRKILFSVLLAFPAAMIFAINNSIWQLFGKSSDFPGYKGFIIVIGFSLPMGIVLCGLGGLGGWLITHNKSMQMKSNQT